MCDHKRRLQVLNRMSIKWQKWQERYCKGCCVFVQAISGEEGKNVIVAMKKITHGEREDDDEGGNVRM